MTAGQLDSGVGRQAGGPLLAPGERVVEVVVAGGDALAATGPGSRVDVVLTTGSDAGAGRSYVALQDVELVDLGTGAGRGEQTAASPRGPARSPRCA